MESLETNLVYSPSRENYVPVIWNPRTTPPPPNPPFEGYLYGRPNDINMIKSNGMVRRWRRMYVQVVPGLAHTLAHTWASGGEHSSTRKRFRPGYEVACLWFIIRDATICHNLPKQ